MVTLGGLTQTVAVDGASDVILRLAEKDQSAASQGASDRAAPPLWTLRWTDGFVHQVEEHRGRPLTHFFFKPNAKGLADQLKLIEDLRRRPDLKGVAWLGVCTEDIATADLKELLKKHGSTLTVGVDFVNHQKIPISASRYQTFREGWSYAVVDLQGRIRLAPRGKPSESNDLVNRTTHELSA